MREFAGGGPGAALFGNPFRTLLWRDLLRLFDTPGCHLRRHFDLLGSIFRPPAPPMRPKSDSFLFLGPPLGHLRRHFDRDQIRQYFSLKKNAPPTQRTTTLIFIDPFW